MSIKIALAGNPNCGKTTLFNALTGSNQFVGNWPGVTVEKKEGKLKWDKEATIMDLPGIYSLSPYTLEEVVARNYLITDRPDAILNIVDGTNIERNLYLSTQIMELGIPVVMAINMMDLVRKSGDQINVDKLSKKLGCPVVEISALKGDGIKEAANKAVELAKKKTLVKNIQAIQNLGAIDVLCTDKTGTLTLDKIVLQKYINVEGKEDLSILEYAFLNSYYSTGMKNLVDKAVITYGVQHKIKEQVINYEKIDEIPFDYIRKKVSIVVKHDDHYRIITKGALEEVLKSCNQVKIDGEHKELTQEMIQNINKNAENLAKQGMQVIALASKREYRGKDIFNSDDEKEMTFIGFVAFLDPPKKEVKSTIKKLKEYGITTKILTGDNQYATENICNLVGIEDSKILLGTDIDRMPDGELAKKVEEVNVFARMNPLQKERIIKALRKNGHVVGYMGDGVNDAPSLHNADVGICVNTATDIAKEASDIILLEKSLKVIFNGVIEGRKVYGNIIKYMKMALSSDFGDVFSIFIASIFLPFLPLLPIQMLIQDFLYDFSQIGIPYDNVDEEFLIKPRKWDTKGLGTFMNVMGPVSSIIDVLAFLAFWFILGYNGAVSESYFQTAWFVECLISETLIIHFVRTEKVPFVQSKANPILTCLTMVTIIGTIFTPILLHNIESFHFEIMPPLYYLIVAGLTILYVILVQIVKKIYIKKVGNWL